MFSADNIVRYSNKCLSNKLSYSKKKSNHSAVSVRSASALISFQKCVCAHWYTVAVDRLMERM